jgi:hypothetical protein
VKRLFLIIFFFCILESILAQNLGLYPEQFTSYFFNYSCINAAYIPEDKKSELLFHTKLRSGVYNDISTIYASFQNTFKSKDNKRHSIRLNLCNEKEGPYISTSRLYGNYALNIKINQNLDFFGGITMGIVNPNYNTPTKTVETTLVDGSLDVIVKYKNSLIGIASKQILNSTSSIFPSIVLKRFYNFNLENKLVLSPKLDLKTYVLLRYFTEIPYQFNYSNALIYNDYIEVGSGYRLKRGVTFFSSITLEKLSDHPLKISFLYSSNLLNQSDVLGDAFEGSVIYYY